MATISGGSGTTAPQNQHTNQEGFTSAFATVTFLFFMWGFITCMNDILIPYLKGVFDLNYTQATLVQFAFFGAYFIGSLVYFLLSVSYGDPISKIGYKNGMMLGLLLAGLGCALFYPAAHFQMYGFFLGALFVLGLGLTLLQIAANPYVALLGKPEGASGRLNLAQGFNSFGTTIAPLIGGYLIFNFFGKTATGADAVKVPYLMMAFLFWALIGLIFRAKLPEFSQEENVGNDPGAFKFRQLRFGIIAIFMYVGGEVAIGSLIISYLGAEQIMGMPEEVAKTYLAFYWGGAMIGRFMGALFLSDKVLMQKLLFGALIAFGGGIMVYVATYIESGLSFDKVHYFGVFLILNLLAFYTGKSQARLTTTRFALIVVALLFTVITGSGTVAMWCVLAIGLFNSVMWSNIFTLAIEGLGKYTSQGSSLLVMAILGGALVPIMQGFVADYAGVQFSFIVPVFCYLYIAWYGLYGSKPNESL
jgi:FHS family L-fucose permease-like MFS transporter